MAIELGTFRTAQDVLTFRLRSDKPLAPASVLLIVTDFGGIAQEVPMLATEGSKDIAFDGRWSTAGRSLGLATIHVSAEDRIGRRSTLDAQLTLKTGGYGYSYSQDYGNSL